MHVRVQIPALNEAATIATVARGALRAVDGLGARASVLVVDDGSTDATPDIVRALGAADPRVATLRSERTRGLGRGFRDGLTLAHDDGVDVLVHIDGDGQFDPDHIGRLVRPVLGDGVDLATASRFSGEPVIGPMSVSRRVGNSLVAGMVSTLARRRMRDVSCGFRAFSRRALETMHSVQLRGDFTYTHETILACAWAGLSIREVPVPVLGTRTHGRSRVARSQLRYGVEATRIIASTWRSERARRPL
jgi:glycosyltransferase involved in cell wall biosynthesis